jgi:hypothetical protein
LSRSKSLGEREQLPAERRQLFWPAFIQFASR